MNFILGTLQNEYLHNELWRWLAGTALAIALFSIIKGVAVYARSKKRQSRTRWVQVMVALTAKTGTFFIFMVALTLSALTLKLSPTLDHVFSNLFFVSMLIQFAVWSQVAIGFVFDAYFTKHDNDHSSQATIDLFKFLVKALVYSLLFLVGLKQFGVDISALVTGLGVGGIAIALAVQNILSDLFSSMTIVIDKPFVVGDSITVDNLTGTVRNIGLKTTRLESSSGEQLIFANSDLLRSRIRNFKRMQQRRIEFRFRVSFNTPPQQLREIPSIIKKIVEAQKDLEFERCHLKEFGDWGIVFEYCYFVDSPEFNLYMDRQESINLELIESFKQKGIVFALSTQKPTVGLIYPPGSSAKNPAGDDFP